MNEPGRTGAVRSRVPWWSGIPFTIVAAVAWIALAVTTPTTTYHFAPTVVAAAWPVSRRLRSAQRLPASELVVSVGGGTALAVLVTVALMATDKLAGPTFFGTDGAVAEAWLMTGLGTLVGLAVALRPTRVKAASTDREQTTRSRDG